jgi:hypothetical protein
VVCLILYTWFVDQLVVIFGQARDVVGHSVANFVCVSIVLKVGMVSEDKNFMPGSKKEMTLVF